MLFNAIGSFKSPRFTASSTITNISFNNSVCFDSVIPFGGAYGVSEFKVWHFGSDKIKGAVTSAVKITGTLQHLYGGLYGRFKGASGSDGDYWEIDVYGSHRKQTNKSNATIEMVR